MVKELTKLKVIHVAGTKGKVNDRACLVQSQGCVLQPSAFQPVGSAGLNLCHGRKHAAAMWLQNWLIHLSSFSGCAGANTAGRVCYTCIKQSQSMHMGQLMLTPVFHMQEANCKRSVHSAFLVVLQPTERV